jgi:peptidoglycan/xylan/chitin deacetylase (PgdA/CDA1 family)
MGGRLVPAVSIMEYLLLERVCTTIFPTGEAAQTAIGGQVLALIKANPALFEVGNHTQHHCNLRDGGGGSGCPAGKPSAAFIASELTTAGATIQALAGQSPVPYWRPPYGAYDTATLTAAAGAGYTKTVLWTVDTIDWRPVTNDPPGPSAYAIAVKIRSTAVDGGVVLLHLGGFNTRDGLPYALAGLRGAGYRTTSISDLLRPG